MKEPSILSKLFSLTKATVSYIASGMKQTTDEELKRRLEICGTCTLFDKENFKCKACGCYLKYKAGWADQHCKEEKW